MRKRRHLESEYNRLAREIDAIRKTGEVAAYGVNIVPYLASNGNCFYQYFKLVAKEPIFNGKNGKKTKTQHLGAMDSDKYREAQLSIKRRNAITQLGSQMQRIKELMSEKLPTAADFKS